MNFYDILFNRISTIRWNGKSDNPEFDIKSRTFSSISIISALGYINVLTFGILFHIETKINSLFIMSIGLIIYFSNYFYFYKLKRYLSIISTNQEFTTQKMRLYSIYTIIYSGLSIFLFFGIIAWKLFF
ncbi:MAG: hypothetical protein ACOYO1_07555 [Bacteroidales bacterium]